MSINEHARMGYVLTFEDLAAEVQAAADELPAAERRAAAAALADLDPADPVAPVEVLRILGRILQARRRTEQIRRSNLATDKRRRTMVGCKCSREFRDQCAAAAEGSYRSLNAWVHEVLYRELRSRGIRSQRSPDPVPDRDPDPDPGVGILLWRER